MGIITFAIGGSGSGFCLKFFCKEICSSFLRKVYSANVSFKEKHKIYSEYKKGLKITITVN